MYIHEIGRIEALPKLAALTIPTAPSAPSVRGRYGARCAFTAHGPTPGPPPPCGMQNVLCRFRCDTSEPHLPGLARPTSAFMFAPSVYTWPPCACTISQISTTSSSNTPCVDGYVIMIAARRSEYFSAARRMSATSTLPLLSHLVTTTLMPHICAEAGLVPCADSGIRHTSRCASPRARW